MLNALGIKVKVTWFYLSRVGAWEDGLPEETRVQVKPAGEVPGQPVKDYGNTMASGPYKAFPNLAADFPGDGGWTVSRANLVAELTSWSVLRAADAFKQALG